MKAMCSDQSAGTRISTVAPANPFSANDVADILRERGWLSAEVESTHEADLNAWLNRAAELLGPHAPDRAAFSALFETIFVYDAAAVLCDRVNQDVLARTGRAKSFGNSRIAFWMAAISTRIVSRKSSKA